MALRPSHLTKSVRIVAISAIVSASLGLGGAALAETPATPTAPTLSPGSLPSRSASTAIHHLASAPAEVTTVDAERLAQVNSTDDYGDVVISPNSMTAYLSVPSLSIIPMSPVNPQRCPLIVRKVLADFSSSLK